jgi:hypothetical protein
MWLREIVTEPRVRPRLGIIGGVRRQEAIQMALALNIDVTQ